MKLMIILRGLPGAGKSICTEILEHYVMKEQSLDMETCSADNYFIDKESGKYYFNPRELGAAHDHCKYLAEENCKVEIPIIIIDNTNTKKSEYRFYLDLAKKYGYETQVITVGEFSDKACELYAQRNIHKVPLATIKKMRDRFEFK